MSARFAGSGVIVTGAGQGIGQSVAEAFAAEGAEVLLVGRTPDTLEAEVGRIASQGGRAWALQADVSVPADVDAVVAAASRRWPRIDVLVNNAAVVHEAPFLEVSDDQWSEVVGIDLTGVFLMSQRVCRAMAGRGGGSVVHIASIDASGADGPYVAYNAAKAGLLGLNRTMAVELAELGIRVNAVSPGFTHTAMTESAVTPEIMDHLLHRFRRVPMRRLVRPAEVAAAVLFLASAEASAITGTNVIVDCGLTANLYILETLPTP
ncbi:SDR family oxidoreductase [Acidimicrobiaceae bacterium USS-CC1]|uniref:SDR family oxidoreductase n=1 Tax=Acidiferrimicrobium australe TaxID=2664430 RepID=A0ABW9QT94_9ACTN|nr:SDR family oxidoreductase [Acidiferrimicrobium australe]